MITLLSATPCAAETPSPEDAVKSSFLQRFSAFVDWPAATFASPTTALRICVFGSATMEGLLRRAATTTTASGRPIQVAALTSVASGESCHVLYVAAATPADTLRVLEAKPVLVVTDAAYGSGGRGVIHFVVVDDRVRFHIDDNAAADAGLSISSRLLSLALSVRRRAAS